jgi:hypothetical protein
MRALLKSINVWALVKFECKRLDKPVARGTKDEKSICIRNDKAINFIFVALSPLGLT